MIKTIFFDLDGVLTLNKTGSAVQAKFFAEKFNLSESELRAKRKEYTIRDNTGEMTNYEAYQEILGSFGIEPSLEVIEESFALTPVDDRMIGIAKDYTKDYKVGIITDNSKDRAEYIAAFNNWDEIFDPIIISADVGEMKTGRKIFDVAVEAVGCEHEECVFIDNTQKNIDSCNSIGMHGIFFDDQVRDYDKMLAEIDAIK